MESETLHAVFQNTKEMTGQKLRESQEALICVKKNLDRGFPFMLCIQTPHLVTQKE